MRNILNTFSENYLLCGGGGCFVKNYYYSEYHYQGLSHVGSYTALNGVKPWGKIGTFICQQPGARSALTFGSWCCGWCGCTVY